MVYANGYLVARHADPSAAGGYFRGALTGEFLDGAVDVLGDSPREPEEDREGWIVPGDLEAHARRRFSSPISSSTAGTSGLGEAAAEALARHGYRVVIVGRDTARGAAVVRRIKAAGGEAEMLVADLFSLADVRRLAKDIEARAPKLDLLVNNAGGSFNRIEQTGDGFERTFPAFGSLAKARPLVTTVTTRNAGRSVSHPGLSSVANSRIDG
jgi:hypothetical protein